MAPNDMLKSLSGFSLYSTSRRSQWKKYSKIWLPGLAIFWCKKQECCGVQVQEASSLKKSLFLLSCRTGTGWSDLKIILFQNVEYFIKTSLKVWIYNGHESCTLVCRLQPILHRKWHCMCDKLFRNTFHFTMGTALRSIHLYTIWPTVCWHLTINPYVGFPQTASTVLKAHNCMGFLCLLLL